MKLKIRIKTPKGAASGMDKKLRPFILGWRAEPEEVRINEEGSQILWTINKDSRKTEKIIRNLSLFDTIVSQVMTSKKVKWAVKKYGDKGSYDELEEILKEHTTVERISLDEGFDEERPLGFLSSLLSYSEYLNQGGQ